MRHCVARGVGFCGAMALALAVESGWAVEATIRAEVNSAYVSRGITVNRDAVFNPLLDVSLGGGIGAYAWGNLDIGDDDGRLRDGEFSETDLAVYYSRKVGMLTAVAGYVEYLYPNQNKGDEEGEGGGTEPGTRELYATLEADFGGGFSAKIGLYRDIGEVDDVYGNSVIAYSWPLAASLTCDVSACIGYAGRDWAGYNSGGTAGGFNEYGTGLALTYNMTESLNFGAQFNFTDSVDENVLPDQETHWFGGVGVESRF